MINVEKMGDGDINQGDIPWIWNNDGHWKRYKHAGWWRWGGGGDCYYPCLHAKTDFEYDVAFPIPGDSGVEASVGKLLLNEERYMGIDLLLPQPIFTQLNVAKEC